MKKLKFNREDNNWYIDLPDWTGTKGELQMVAGADLFLDKLDEDFEDTVEVLADVKEFDGWDIRLKKSFNSFGGAIYTVKGAEFGLPIWLCAVTKYVFDNTLPKLIYIKLEKDDKKEI